MIGSLIREIDIGKKDTLNKLLAKALEPRDLEIRDRLNHPKNVGKNYDDGDNPPSSLIPPPLPPPNLPLPPENFLLPPPPPSDVSFLNFDNQNLPTPPTFEPRSVRSRRNVGNITQKLSGDRLIRELERVIKKKEKEEEAVVADESVVDFIEKAAEIIDYEYLLDQEKKEQELAEIKEEYNFDNIFDKINEDEVPEQLEFYFGGDNQSFFENCQELDLSAENANFINFLLSNLYSVTLGESNLSIYNQTNSIY